MQQQQQQQIGVGTSPTPAAAMAAGAAAAAAVGGFVSPPGRASPGQPGAQASSVQVASAQAGHLGDPSLVKQEAREGLVSQQQRQQQQFVGQQARSGEESKAGFSPAPPGGVGAGAEGEVKAPQQQMQQQQQPVDAVKPELRPSMSKMLDLLGR